MGILINFLKLICYIVVVTFEFTLKFLLDIVTYIKKWFTN